MNRLQLLPSGNIYLVRMTHRLGTQGTCRSRASAKFVEMAGARVSPSQGVHGGHGEPMKDFRKQSQVVRFAS